MSRRNRSYQPPVCENFYNYDVHVVTDLQSCRHFVKQIRRHCASFPVLGFDCEWWTTKGPQRRMVALMQLASPGGLCVLIRLCRMNSIPSELANLLRDDRIFKVGIQPLFDGMKLYEDYGIEVRGTLDLRFLAHSLNVPGPYRLAALAENLLGVEMNKQWWIPASNWETPMLTDDQVDYAAKDAIAGLEIFHVFNNQMDMG